MEADGKREHEMKAILCGWYVERERSVGKTRGREIEVLFIHPFIQQTIPKHLLCKVQRWVLGM